MTTKTKLIRQLIEAKLKRGLQVAKKKAQNDFRFAKRKSLQGARATARVSKFAQGEISEASRELRREGAPEIMENLRSLGGRRTTTIKRKRKPSRRKTKNNSLSKKQIELLIKSLNGKKISKQKRRSKRTAPAKLRRNKRRRRPQAPRQTATPTGFPDLTFGGGFNI